MAKKKTIGLCYFFDNKSNSGIVNYIYNIISGLNSLEDHSKPKIIVFYSLNAPVNYLKSIHYPYIKFVLLNDYKSLVLRKINSLIKRIFKIDLFIKTKRFKGIDGLYPYFDFFDYGFGKAKNKIHWLVDFNNRAFPQHYEDGGELMRKYQEKITLLHERVVLSSNALLNELKNYHPNYNCDVKILKFASSLPTLNDAAIGPLLEKYKIDGPYFMSPNQFWEHKNQALVLDALHIIQTHYPNVSFKILFTGSLDVNRGKGFYVDKLKSKIAEYKLDRYILFLGVLERNEQLLLMKKSIALLQPSLYEGWSTLVEEAKALNKFILLSDLPVHREQIFVNVDFFNPYNAEELAAKMYSYLQYQPEIVITDYAENIKEFGKKVLDVLVFE